MVRCDIAPALKFRFGRSVPDLEAERFTGKKTIVCFGSRIVAECSDAVWSFSLDGDVTRAESTRCEHADLVAGFDGIAVEMGGFN